MPASVSNETPRSHVRVIRDNIHGYIALTVIESAFLAQEEFHRLHFISQNGLAFHTYPSTRHTRFLHSLGTMHIAGRMLISAMRKAGPAATSFRDAFKSYIEKKHRFLLKRMEQIAKHDVLYEDLGIQNDSLLCAMFQGVRLASLIHDIGHPPFSHTVEGALEMAVDDVAGSSNETAIDLKNQVYSLYKRQKRIDGLHERIGGYLLGTVMVEGLADTLEPIATDLVELAIAISAEYKLDKVLGALKGIIDGQFDCDRADYVLRDCAAAGVDFGGYDLERIIPNMEVVEASNSWYFRPNLRALSALESYYEERSRLYRWIVYHLSCVRSHIALQRAVICTIRLACGVGEFRSQEFDRFRSATRSIQNLWNFAEYRKCDESWLFSFFATLIDEIIRYQSEIGEENCSRSLQNLLGFAQQARWRKKGMFVLWKRIDEYDAFCAGVSDVLHSDGNPGETVPQINAWLQERFALLGDQGFSGVEWLESKLEEALGRPVVVDLALPKGAGSDPGLERKSEDVADWGVLLIDPQSEDPNDVLVPLARVSPIPISLQTVWENSIQLHAYAISWNLSRPDDLPSPEAFGRTLANILSSAAFEERRFPAPETITQPSEEVR